MTVSFLYFLVSLLHRAQLWADGLGMPCSALNPWCAITANGKQLTGKLGCTLQLHEIDKQKVLYHLLPSVIHRLLNPD
jgi:hypothetical protein